MIRRYGSQVLMLVLIALVATACLVRTRGRSRTVYREAPHDKHHDHHDNGRHNGHHKH